MPTPLTLKQRLSALNINASSSTRTPGEQFASPSSPSMKWRPFSSRRGTEDGFNEVLGLDRIQEVMSRVVFQAGVDYETRPMLIMNASALPDPKEVSYDLLLSRILSYLDLYVESDYTVVFFAAGSRHTPGWNWVWKAYRSLSRKYRKNLKRLVIVHSNFFTKMLFSLAGAIISPKFFRKVTYTNTLSELASQVPITQIDIPSEVYKENLKHEQEIVLPVPHRADMFGVPLEELMGYDGEKGGVPRVVRDTIQYMRLNGLEEEGLFRRNPSNSALNQLIQAYNRGHVVSLESHGNVHMAAVLLKKYLHALPEPLFPEKMYPLIERCPQLSNDASDMSSIIYIRESILPELPHCAYILLTHVFQLLHDVSLRSSANLMDAHNLAICLTPTLVRSNNISMDFKMSTVTNGPSMSPNGRSATTNPHPLASTVRSGANTLGNVVVLCIQRYFEIFDEVPDRTEARPIPSPSAQPASASASRSPSPSFHHSSSNRDSLVDDDEDIDDAMLVMPIGPNASGSRSGAANGSTAASPPSAWAPGAGPSTTKYRPRHRNTKSRESRDLDAAVGAARSVHTTGAVFGVSGSGNGFPSGRAKSTISIEKGGPLGTARRGSIAIGRGTSRKGSGSAVEAMGVSASGFFTPPSSVPPVPSLPKQ